jgi:hypothetical protein
MSYFLTSYAFTSDVTDLFVFQAQINVMANRQNASSNSQPSTHADNDSSPSANSLAVANATSAAPSAPPDTGASAVQSETAGSNTNQTQDAPQTQSERQQVSSEGKLESTRSAHSMHC